MEVIMRNTELVTALKTILKLSEIEEIHAEARKSLGLCSLRELQAQYNELLFAVARKFPGETRHQTALRYIHEAESRANSPDQQAAKEGP